MELNEKERAIEHKVILVAYGISAALLLIGVISIWLESAVGFLLLLFSGCIAGCAFYKQEQKNKRKNFVAPNSVQITRAMIFYRERNVDSVVMMYRGAGFTSVTAIPLNDLGFLSSRRNGNVESVIINGSSEFEEGDFFPRDSSVLVNFHSLRGN